MALNHVLILPDDRSQQMLSMPLKIIDFGACCVEILPFPNVIYLILAI